MQFAVVGATPSGLELYKFTHPDTQQVKFAKFEGVSWKGVGDAEVPDGSVYAELVDD